MKQRRAIQDIVYNNPLSLEPEENDQIIDLPTELESLILTYIKHNRKRLSKKMQKLLEAEVVTNGATFNSPEVTWKNDLFKKWAEERLSWLSQQPGARVEQAVYLLRNYSSPKYGWFAFLELHINNRIQQTNIPEAKVETVDIRWDY